MQPKQAIVEKREGTSKKAGREKEKHETTTSVKKHTIGLGFDGRASGGDGTKPGGLGKKVRRKAFRWGKSRGKKKAG